MVNLLAATLICTGTAPTTPMTNIEVEVRPAHVKYSTIRYEIAEGSLTGTAYIQSIGYMHGSRRGMVYTFKSGNGPNATVLVVRAHGDHILESHLSHYISGMKNSPVDCSVEEDSGDHH